MARISGINIPTNKKVHIALTYIFGIGKKISNDICKDASVDVSKRVSELNDEELNKILERENRIDLYKDCLKFLKTRVNLDLALFKDDIWSH